MQIFFPLGFSIYFFIFTFMCKLLAQTLRLSYAASKLELPAGTLILVYNIPTKFLHKLKSKLRPYNNFNLYKRVVKHAAVAPIFKAQFVPGMGFLKFDSLVFFDKFLLDYKNLLIGFPSLKLLTVFFRKNDLFYSSFQNFSAVRKFFDQNLRAVQIFQCFKPLLKIIFILKQCMFFSIFALKKNAYT